MAIIDDTRVRCRGLCGAAHTDENAALRAGWSCLQITAGWRCGACERALLAAGRMKGHDRPSDGDPLPLDSRGALPRETATSILAPAVKG